MENITGNIGEWSELYVLLRLVSDRKIHAADKNVNRIDDIYFPILNIYRNEKIGMCDYNVTKEDYVEIYLDNELKSRISYNDFRYQADLLLSKLTTKHITQGKGSLMVEELEDFMYELNCKRLAAQSSDKSDILMKVHDYNNGFEPICGFSIKSELGGAPTLVNASKATNFIYEITSLTDSEILKINQINTRNKIKERMNMIFANHDVKFIDLSNGNFRDNMMKIDTMFPQIMSSALIYHYRDNISLCKDIVEKLELENPLNYPKGKRLYEYKFKKFLCAVALGMMPSKDWNGIDEATGGYIIVKSNGEVLAFYIYNRDMFEDYLLCNTKFERGSTSKHDYAYVYSCKEKKFINLNLSIRFIK